jgi:signal transduction histidine kinase
MSKTKESSTSIPDDIKSKICCLRLSFIASMIAAAVICGSIVFTRVHQLELDLAEQSFYSVAASAIKGAQAITRRKIQGGYIMATTISYGFPNASAWPFAALPGYTDISATINGLSSSPISFAVIIRPDQATEFETFASKVYREQHYPEGAGASEFGFGVWKIDAASSPYSDKRVHDISGNTSYGGKRSIIVPVLLHTNITARSLLYNSYSENITGPAQDSLIDCVENGNVTGRRPHCITLTKFFELKSRPGPAATILQPVSPINDPAIVVGFTSTAIVWEDVLSDVVPDYVNGLYCVISNENESFTYTIVDGKPELIGKGDLHDKSYDHYKIVARISAVDDVSTASSIYNLTIYPSDELFDSKSPWSLTIGFVMVIVVCTVIFFLYDLLMRNEARQRKVIIEMKRRFVRFVSHEIRTPLNTVCLGLELLQADLPLVTNTAAGQEIQETTHFAHCSTLVDDILENANNAVGILNDLLNYDKMEQGTFKLEIGVVPIWDVIGRAVSSFDIQAKKRSIELITTIEKPIDENNSTVDLFRLRVLGDDVRLRQVIRNIISNSLKFCPENTGKVHVTMSHNANGLPNAVTPREDIVNEATSNTLACSYPRAGSILVIVKDNGVGMTEAQLNQLFQEGVQFEPNKLQVSLSYDKHILHAIIIFCRNVS